MASSAAINSTPLLHRPRSTSLSLCIVPLRAARALSIRSLRVSRFTALVCSPIRFSATRNHCEAFSSVPSPTASRNFPGVGVPPHCPRLRKSLPSERAPSLSQPSNLRLTSAAASATIMGAVAISPNFTPLPSLVGGVLIGLAASLYLFLLGRIMGVSGIVNGALTHAPDWPSRSLFLSVMVAVGAVVMLVYPNAYGPLTQPSVGQPGIVSDLILPAIAGLLVGYGTQMGSGCTSGHGVCGLPRLSLRSLVAVCTFMATGAITATLATNVANSVLSSVPPAAAESLRMGAPWLNAVLALSVLTSLALLVYSLTSSKPPLTPERSSKKDGSSQQGAPADASSSTAASPAPSSAAVAAISSAVQVSVVQAVPVVESPAVMLSAAASAALFSVGLALSGMLNPIKVRAFLDPLHGWDPSLAFVMGGAVAVNLLLFRLILCQQQPAVCPAFCVPTNNRSITTDLVMGAAIFGTGWGLAGFCPGPGIVSLATGKVSVIVWAACMLLGMRAFGNLKVWRSTKTKHA